MSHFTKTDTILDKILAHKVDEIAAAQREVPLAELRSVVDAQTEPPNFVSALQRETVALIAEVKKASPSKGVLIEDFDHLGLAKLYAEHGAAAISVLTDQQFFQGNLAFLREVNQNVTIPTLRKDFIIDPYQIYEARAAGAAAVLLIVAALSDSQLSDLHAQITALGMSALVEVHNRAELERALNIQDLALLGINNRDLKTFQVELSTTQQLAADVPEHLTLVAESGLKSSHDIARMGAFGAHAVLIGEGLVTASDIAATVRDFSSQARGN